MSSTTFWAILFWLQTALVVTITSCGSRYESYSMDAAPEYQMECMDAHRTGAGFLVERCENFEVVCYRYSEGGISCMWKEQEEVGVYLDGKNRLLDRMNKFAMGE